MVIRLRKDVKKDIIQIILIAIILIFAFLNIKEIWSFLKFIIDLIMPFIIGIAIAFVLNILMKFIERKLLDKANMKSKNKRTISETAEKVV